MITLLNAVMNIFIINSSLLILLYLYVRLLVFLVVQVSFSVFHIALTTSNHSLISLTLCIHHLTCIVSFILSSVITVHAIPFHDHNHVLVV